MQNTICAKHPLTKVFFPSSFRIHRGVGVGGAQVVFRKAKDLTLYYQFR